MVRRIVEEIVLETEQAPQRCLVEYPLVRRQVGLVLRASLGQPLEQLLPLACISRSFLRILAILFVFLLFLLTPTSRALPRWRCSWSTSEAFLPRRRHRGHSTTLAHLSASDGRSVFGGPQRLLGNAVALQDIDDVAVLADARLALPGLAVVLLH